MKLLNALFCQTETARHTTSCVENCVLCKRIVKHAVLGGEQYEGRGSLRKIRGKQTFCIPKITENTICRLPFKMLLHDWVAGSPNQNLKVISTFLITNLLHASGVCVKGKLNKNFKVKRTYTQLSFFKIDNGTNKFVHHHISG